MAITTAGGSGSGSTALGANSGTSISLFTTPNTTNGIFLVNITWSTSGHASGVNVISHGTGAAATQSASSGGGPLMMRVGPNTTVYLTVGELLANATTVYWSYSYLSVVIT